LPQFKREEKEDEEVVKSVCSSLFVTPLRELQAAKKAHLGAAHIVHFSF